VRLYSIRPDKPLFLLQAFQLFDFFFTEVGCLSDDFHIYSHFQEVYCSLFSAFCFALGFAICFAFNSSMSFAFNPSLIIN
jgi:hypothetical protein